MDAAHRDRVHRQRQLRDSKGTEQKVRETHNQLYMTSIGPNLCEYMYMCVFSFTD